MGQRVGKSGSMVLGAKFALGLNKSGKMKFVLDTICIF